MRLGQPFLPQTAWRDAGTTESVPNLVPEIPELWSLSSLYFVANCSEPRPQKSTGRR